MSFSQLWTIRRLIFVFPLLMAAIIFDWGIISCTCYRLPSKQNSSKTGNGDSEYKFLHNYFSSIVNKSRDLEEAIYADILNNLKSLIKAENAQSVESVEKEYKTPDAKGKSEKIECRNRNNSGSKPTSYKTNVFLSGANEIVNAEGSPLYGPKNVTFEEEKVHENEYFLGYSGNPFGSRQPLVGFFEVPENSSLAKGIADPRKKRSVLHLYNMVLCSTGCNPFAYKGYGCYCGFLGSGFVVDGIDSCCKMHDWCYNSAGCPTFLEYFIPYLWKCYHHQPLCAIDHEYYGGSSSCAQRLCECDRQLALCLQRYPCPSTKALCTSSPWSRSEMGESDAEKLRDEFVKNLKEEAEIMVKNETEKFEERIRWRKDFIRKLELERREASLNGVVLKAQEVSTLQENQYKQEENLAAELDLIRRQEIVDLKLRQKLRENSHELKELESQLKAAYRKKTIAAQLAEKEADKLEDQIREIRAREILDKAVGSWQKQEEEMRIKERKQKEEFKQLLQDQIIEKERIRQEEFFSFMKEKKMFDDILQAIKDEEIKLKDLRESFVLRDLEKKKYMQQKLKEEMDQFHKAREVWKAKERLYIQEEEEKRRQINEEKAKSVKQDDSLKKLKEENFQKLYNKLSWDLAEKMRKTKEREDLMSALTENAKLEEEKRKAQLDLEREMLKRRETRESYKQLLAAKARKQKEEKDLDAHFAQLMKEKTDEEERKEKEKQEQRRATLINNRKYNEEAMKRNVQKRAEELKLTQLINELQERDEKKKAELLEEERIRILREHVPKLLGYFPKGCLREKDLEALGLTWDSVANRVDLPRSSCPLIKK